MTKVSERIAGNMGRLEAHLTRQPSDTRAARQAIRMARRTKRRMDEMDRDLRRLAARYHVYRGLFERCMDIIKHQAEMIHDYAAREEPHVTRRLAEIKKYR